MILTMKSIAAAVAARHGLRVRDLTGDNRVRHMAYARHEAMWEMRQVRRADGQPRYSLAAVGSFFNRDHTTVVYAERQHPKRVDKAVLSGDKSTAAPGVIPVHQTRSDTGGEQSRLGFAA
ncbi:MAG: helix-turn-helix domain-containing protein [Caulobacter sp.]|nr:helix-turn-helix domain-containing protein [Caulobacter sp.]